MALCECGCGRDAPIAQRTNRAKGHVRGQPTRFIAGHQSPEARRRTAAAKRGRARSPEVRAKISAALTGKSQPDDLRALRVQIATRKSASPTWVGERVSYNGAHNRARLELPVECAHADVTCKGPLEAALRPDVPEALIRVSPRGHRYYVGDEVGAGYHRLCRSHHRRQDLAEAP